MIPAFDTSRLRVPLSELPGIAPEGESCLLATSQGVIRCTLDQAPVSIDFAEPATRDRAARWLLATVGGRPQCTAPPWTWSDGGTWRLHGGAMFWPRPPRGPAPIGDTWITVSELQQLDVRDGRVLPDGSRYVEALALALVCAYVGRAARGRS